MTTTNTRIKKVRKALDLTQQEFADRLGVKRNTVATYEAGKSKPSDAATVLICKTFNVNETWLRTGEGEMFRPEPADELDKLLAEYGLPKAFRAVSESYLQLEPNQQEAVVKFMENLAVKLSADSAAEPAEPDAHALYEAEARAKAEAYYRELMQEREQTDGQSVFLNFNDGDLLA